MQTVKLQIRLFICAVGSESYTVCYFVKSLVYLSADSVALRCAGCSGATIFAYVCRPFYVCSVTYTHNKFKVSIKTVNQIQVLILQSARSFRRTICNQIHFLDPYTRSYIRSILQTQYVQDPCHRSIHQIHDLDCPELRLIPMVNLTSIRQ